MNRCKADCVYFDPTSFSQSQDVETMRVLMNHLADRRIPAELMPDTLDASEAKVRVLWPTAEVASQKQLSDNDKSLVCLIEYAGRKVLLCSDIEGPAQERVLALYPDLKADVVVVPHHGSVRTLHSGFLDQLAPSLLVCSCGQRDCEQGRVIKSSADRELRITAQDAQ